MNKKATKITTSKQDTETRPQRLQRRIGELRSERELASNRLQQIVERISQIDGAVFELSSELAAEQPE